MIPGMNQRRIVQISAADGGLYALANDGTLWTRRGVSIWAWALVEPLPDQDPAPPPTMTVDDVIRWLEAGGDLTTTTGQDYARALGQELRQRVHPPHPQAHRVVTPPTSGGKP